jgi:GntR family transcriptional regulator, transcriptional repressor for pyruvate dehydrogenase complex
MPNESLTIRVTNFIFDHIRRNELSSGEALPSELKTSTELNVSRGVVREAFRSLEVAGILEKENGRSPKVGVLNSSFLRHLLVHALATKQVSLRQVLELRASIEVKAAEMAARRRKPADVQKLWAQVEGMRRSVNRTSAFVQHDVQFHQIISRATGNPLVEIISGAMYESIQESIRIGLTKRRNKEDILHVVDYHAAIAEAIENGSPAQAELKMKRHFEETLRALAKVELDMFAE